MYLCRNFVPIMQVFLRYIYTIILSFLCISGVRADNLRISLLTCSPGNDAYAHFGHTAIRVVDYDTYQDEVYNYGCFDYNESMFIYKFIKGETDYVLGVEPAKYFFYRYQTMGLQVEEQVLNFSNEEAINIVRLLEENLLPENVEYRYNYLYDNCTTRARNVIESALTDDIVYKKAPIKLTAREELHKFMQKAPWLRFGIDLVLGEKLDDKDFDQRHQMFIPSHYEAELDSAFILLEDGTEKPLVGDKHTILVANPEMQEQAPFITPMMVLILLGLVIIYFCIQDIMRKHVSYWIDITLSSIQGLAGIIVAFLFFCSEHPTVDSNWLVIILNPLYLLYAAYLGYCAWKKKANMIVSVNMAVLGVFFVMMMFVKQAFSTEIYLMAFLLLLRAITAYTVEKRKRKHINHQK